MTAQVVDVPKIISPSRETTSFQTGSAYRPELDVGADLVIVANNNKEVIESWKKAGYPVAVMYGFRDSIPFCEGKVDGINRMEEVQTTRNGKKLDCGNTGYYMVPNASKTARAVDFFRKAIRNGAIAACPEEPEFWGMAGYSGSFKQCFADYYRRPWVDPESSPQARFVVESLKARMECEMFKAIYRASREENPDIRRFMLFHSPVNYAAWRVGFTHPWAITSRDVDEIIAQVWTGTARSPVPLAGQNAERTFLNALLEYSSSKNLVRSSQKPIWFLMDPVEDNPDRSMDDYIINYRETLLAAMMVPEIDRFELMPWPERIFGRVPQDYATVIHTVARVLKDLTNYPDAIEQDCGTTGIGVLMGETTSWMNNPPDSVGMNGFYGLALPLSAHGIPVEVLMAEQIREPHYLDGIHTLLISTEFMKPMSKDIADNLVEWTRRGGVLLIFGGRNQYDEVEGWWHHEGYASPLDYLLVTTRGLSGRTSPESETEESLPWEELSRAETPFRNLENLNERRFDVTAYLNNERKVWIRFRDAWPEDGWGPYVTSATSLADGTLLDSFIPGTPEEASHLIYSMNSLADSGRRFADQQGYLIYEFLFPEGVTKAEVMFRIGNQYIIEATPASKSGRTIKGENGWNDLTITPGMRLTTWPIKRVRGTPLLTTDNGQFVVSWIKQVECGLLYYCGLSPDCFALDRNGDRMIRNMVRDVIAQSPQKTAEYRENGYYMVRRGPYLAVRVLEGGVSITGRFLDLLDAKIPVARQINLHANDGGLYLDLDRARAKATTPLLFCTARISSVTKEGDGYTYVVQGALGTPQRLLIYTQGKTAEFSATGKDGHEVPIARQDVGTLSWLELPGNPEGTWVRLRFN